MGSINLHSRTWWPLAGLVTIGGFFLITDPWATFGEQWVHYAARAPRVARLGGTEHWPSLHSWTPA